MRDENIKCVVACGMEAQIEDLVLLLTSRSSEAVIELGVGRPCGCFVVHGPSARSGTCGAAVC